jgi:hypothetical protein
MKKISVWIILILLVGCEATDETKMKDTQEAFSKIKFDHRVSQNVKTINDITNLIISNKDDIFSYNGIKLVGYEKRQGIKSVNIFKNTMNQTLPTSIASEMKMIFNELPSQFIFAITIYNDDRIVYSIRPKKTETKPLNYKVQHKLIYGKRSSTNSELSSVMDALSKEKFIEKYQYYIKVEPYNGW